MESDVLRAAEARASALADGDPDRLLALLHEGFRWTTHVGTTYDRAEYVRRNTEGDTVLALAELVDTRVVVVGDTAVLHAQVSDVVWATTVGRETFRMPMTQVWVRDGDAWLCLAGHAGPRMQ